MRHLIVLSLLLLAGVCHALTDAEVDNATRLFCNGRYGECFYAMAACGTEAMVSNPRFLCLYADYLRYGLDKSDVKRFDAVLSLRSAASKGEPAAKFALLQMKMAGGQADVYLEDAYRGLMVKYSAGDEYAGVYLADMLLHCNFAHRNPHQAVEILTPYAEHNPMAQALLGRVYLDGADGVPVNRELGYKYLDKAGHGGYLFAWLDAAVYRLMAGEPQKAVGYAAASRKSAMQSADQGDVRVADALSFFVAYDGYHYSLDKRSIKWLQLSAEKGNPPPRVHLVLGNCYQLGQHVTANLALAIWHYRIAAEGGDATAQRFLAQLYEEGKVPDIDNPRKSNMIARNWYTKAAENGDEDARWRLVRIYLKAEVGALQDPILAKKWLKALSENGDADAVRMVEKIERTEEERGY